MADAFEDDTEQTYTLDEYIDEIEAEELEVDLILGGDEGKECTYTNGYMKRQAVFSCLTCAPQGNAGVCTACSITCHDGHEVIELWTKRRFRCDCGNSSKFNNLACKLCPEKETENSENSYNQNFKGLYCTCARPYPDPAVQEQVNMIQCCICEDWFHEDHLGLSSVDEIPRDEEGEPMYEDFICKKCAIIFSFLKLYPSSIWVVSNPKIEASENNPNPKIETSENNPNPCENGSGPSNKSNKGKEPMNEEIQISKICKVEQDINSIEIQTGEETGPLFLCKKWREMLCKCENCMEFYNKNKIKYLTEKEDTIEEYEIMANQKRQQNLQNQEGAEMNFINKLDHVQKIEILNGISDMKDEFRSFMESYDPSKPITSDDVRGIFENLKKKKQRLI
ncbi:hypothetical protein LUZ60_010097 [Juncus effusus]|nr:hypothetical protein LUZ60_010097 [Juncus effusus]